MQFDRFFFFLVSLITVSYVTHGSSYRLQDVNKNLLTYYKFLVSEEANKYAQQKYFTKTVNLGNQADNT